MFLSSLNCPNCIRIHILGFDLIVSQSVYLKSQWITKLNSPDCILQMHLLCQYVCLSLVPECDTRLSLVTADPSSLEVLSEVLRTFLELDVADTSNGHSHFVVWGL